jgi:hypothetical protein
MVTRNCWIFMKCPNSMKHNCDVFLQGYRKECWLISKDFMKGCPSAPKSCEKCSCYNYKNNGHEK